MSERWHVWARADWKDGGHLTAGCDANAAGLSLREAVEYGLDSLFALGGDCIDTDGDQLTVTVKLVEHP